MAVASVREASAQVPTRANGCVIVTSTAVAGLPLQGEIRTSAGLCPCEVGTSNWVLWPAARVI